MRSFDVAVVGGGLIGGSIAFDLAQQGLRVVLLDRQAPGQEASWAAAGMLSPAPDSPDSIPLVPLGAASLALYPEFVARIEEASGRKANFQHDGALVAFFAGDSARELSTLIALHHGLGVPTEALRLDEALGVEPALNREACAAALLPEEASVDNRALTDAVLAAAARQGATIRAGTEVTAIKREASRCTGILAGREMIAAGNVVIAAGCFSEQIEGVAPYAPTRPVRGQMVALRSSKVQLGRVLHSERGYLVPRGDRLLAGSTLENVGFEKRVTASGLEGILGAALELVPALADAEIVETWSGLRPDTPDHLPAIGPTDLDGLIVATGHYRSGLLLAPITAKLIREWLTEQRVSLSWEPFSPLRFLAAKQSAERPSRGSRVAR